ncbi:transient receptor potential channel pyrexia-like [Polistes fuscatus]|uniref:transient receptor potential channel pyrexia-like n=1 Tax=Polistes fuscatus TaxID=30207 RepID=UPI001CA8D6FD|nr:transient receptor potential channel pyrexia-like [Polistes fuscatus]XP_043495105.1 transient receptor potential channel pyrexia-like [Polistes fuscatus]XP_043495106.1 transient receptor potential channel pyrexia-like [Polistes fuscatus]XP_043495107.1 transient receptor potential channel pyrexia-like [Polistes fuscatus]
MSLLKNKFFKRLSGHSSSQGESRKSDKDKTPSIIVNYENSEDDIWMDEIDKKSISSEETSEPVICHIRQRPMNQQQLWTKDEITLALSNLPAGEVALATIPTLYGSILQKTLEELQDLHLRKLHMDYKRTCSFTNGCIKKTILISENNTAATATPTELLVKWPETCLLVACWVGHFEIVKILLEKNVNISCTDEDGRTPVHLAASAAFVRILEKLLSFGADPCEWDFNKKCTPLHCAAAAGNVACIKSLIKAKADVDAGFPGKTPLHYAVLNNAVDSAEVLLQAGAHPNNPQVYTETPLHVAASLGSVPCMKLLLSYGADVRVQLGTARSTPIHLTAEEGSAECTKLLVNAGASCEAKNSKGQTAMHLAALAQSSETLEVLINAGATVNVEDIDGRTPLHAAVAKSLRATELVKILIQAGASVNKPDKYGYTPLHIAALNENSSTVMMLLSKGADVTVRTKGGISALSFIIRRTPDVLPRFVTRLDQAISLYDHELGDVDCELRLDFRPLVPGGKGETDLMLCLIEVGQGHILKHPLCESFLYLKWLRIRKFFLFSLIFHSIFVIFFTGYIAVTYLWNMENFSKILFWLILTYTCMFIIKELFQIAHDVCCYVKRWENWLQWCVILTSCCVLIKPINNWQHHVAALGILLIWIELMIVVGRFPMFGLYIQMFTQVSINFFKFLGAYICLIIGFSLGFCVLHKNYKSFENPLIGLLKTIIMMSGELEFEDVYFDKEFKVLYTGTSHLMLLSFVILVTVILTNLMVGLAVSDIQELRRCAGLDRLVRRAELVSYLEGMLFSKVLNYAPKNLMRTCRREAMLLHPPYHCAIQIRPNDPREKRLPRDLVKAIYRLVCERKVRNTTNRGTFMQSVNALESDYVKFNQLQSINSSTEYNQQQLNELANELKRCSYNITMRLNSLTNRVENIAKDLDVSVS